MKKSNIICFIISLILLRFGIGGVKFCLENGIFAVKDSAIAGIELLGSMFSYFWLIVASIVLMNGIILAIVTINLGSKSIKEAENEVIGKTNMKSEMIIEIIIYAIWIILAFV